MTTDHVSASHGESRTSLDFPAAGELKALIFDVDGTLYDQNQVRRAMLFPFLRAHFKNPVQGFLTLRSLQAYRSAQEALRLAYRETDDITSAQLQLAARKVSTPVEIITSTVTRWMEREPLPLLANSRRKGIVELLQKAKQYGLRLGVCSDYPTAPKLVAMGLSTFFDVVVTAQDREVQRFKPDPTGLEVTVRRLGVKKDEVVYIGDRPEVDAIAACRAGIRPFILDRTHTVAELLELLIPRN